MIKTTAIAALALVSLSANGQEITLPGGWEMSRTVNPMDDTVVARVYKESENHSESEYFAPELQLRCRDAELELFVSWFNPLLQGGPGMIDKAILYFWPDLDVQVRLGAESAENHAWVISTSHSSAFFTGNLNAFLARMNSADQIAVEVSLRWRRPIVASWALVGFPEAMKPVTEHCS